MVENTNQSFSVYKIVYAYIATQVKNYSHRLVKYN